MLLVLDMLVMLLLDDIDAIVEGAVVSIKDGSVAISVKLLVVDGLVRVAGDVAGKLEICFG